MTNIKLLVRKSILYKSYLWLRHSKYHSRTYMEENNIPIGKVCATGVTEEQVFDGRNITVSLTSFPDRIRFVDQAISTILQQDLKPNRVILWLAESQFPKREKNLPKRLLNLRKYGLTIQWVEEDIRSYKKIIPTLQQFPNDLIITADDDLLYPRDWTRRLVDSYRRDPSAIHCHLIIQVVFRQDYNVEFRKVFGHAGDGSTADNYKILSGAGALFPPGTLYDDVQNKDLFLKLAPTNDDIWLWAMALKKGTKICWIENGMKRLYEASGVSEFTPCMYKVNNFGENKRLHQMLAVFKYYDLFQYL